MITTLQFPSKPLVRADAPAKVMSVAAKARPRYFEAGQCRSVIVFPMRCLRGVGVPRRPAPTQPSTHGELKTHYGAIRFRGAARPVITVRHHRGLSFAASSAIT